MEFPTNDLPHGFGHSGGYSNSSAIMESLDGFMINREGLDTDSNNYSQPKLKSKTPKYFRPDVTLTNVLQEDKFTSLKLGASTENGNLTRSFLLLDGNEQMKVSSGSEFVTKLGCDPGSRVKVVSIFGNTGDGKSFTLNQTFFRGEEVFRTSCEQTSCTLGVWAAYDPRMKVICLDTEGLLGSTSQENQRTRLLLKVLAVSDIVVYRTRAERLHNDIFKFLGWASRAYTQHFQGALAAVGGGAGGGLEGGRPLSALGPAVILFHETHNTRTLHSSANESPEDIVRSRFAQLQLEMDAFSSVRYVGVRTEVPPTSFHEFHAAVNGQLDNTTVRSAREPTFVYATLKALNDKFSGAISTQTEALCLDQYFTCGSVCLSCEGRCQRSMGHTADGTPHSSSKKCRYQHQYDNCVYVCKACYQNGKEEIVTARYTSASDSSWFGLAKYAWSGSVIECPNCGEIYRSRQFWYGNNQPEAGAVRTEIQHVWPGVSMPNQSTHNSAQRVLDSVNYLADAVASLGSPPTRAISAMCADYIAPKYWKPNHEIKVCVVCRKYFGTSERIHHCRQCGDGVCGVCSTRARAVPERGWPEPVRVCDICYESRPPSQLTSTAAASDANSDCLNGNESSVSSELSLDDANDTIPRKCGEVVVNTISSVVSVLEHPKSWIKESARPAYWVRDCDVKACCVCQESLAAGVLAVGGRPAFHHCRDCGQGVCDKCSQQRRPVPHRNWDQPVRVCDNCFADRRA
ncbi:zinc finger FYVE domain-containing protein 1 [Nilaparvata lugens]|uniref:zinc finger FYVE domain-containing protein 1 n=1 Tax=Nilaparvata lugens TaxID=108931 RepID=UPI00193CF8DF|nr:zinc finger FYVE domain-containing protein 1 [Nilaparvata lugens]